MSSKIQTESGFVLLLPLLILLLVVTAAAAAMVFYNAQEQQKQQAQQKSTDARIGKLHKASKVPPPSTPLTDTNTTPAPAAAPAVTTSKPVTTSPKVTAKPTTPTTVAPSPVVPAAPTTVQIGNYTYLCDESDNIHWTRGLYGTKNPTYSYTAPGGGQLNSYAQWASLTGLSCSSTAGWLQRGSEFFLGTDLVVS
jgi:hypothetical protein